LREPERLVLVGVFGAPQGVRGEIRVKSFTADPKAIGAYGALTDAQRANVFAFERLRALRDDMVVVKVKGVETRGVAAALTGVEIFARRDQLPPSSEDEFYHADLVGLEAVTREGERLGSVVSICNYGAGDILEIAPESGGETLLLPFTRRAAPVVDFEAGRIVVEPPREVEGEPHAPQNRSTPPLSAF
jgi:16S rRNA processing protein RimM